MSRAESIAGLLLDAAPEVQQQGWELLGSLPDVPVADVCAAMQAGLWAMVSRVQAGARIRTLDEADCLVFARRYVALRSVCAALSVPWSAAWLRVDGGRASRSHRDQSTTAATLQRGRVCIGRVRSLPVAGGYARIALPQGHPLRGSERFGRRWSKGIALSEDEIRARSTHHPAAV